MLTLASKFKRSPASPHYPPVILIAMRAAAAIVLSSGFWASPVMSQGNTTCVGNALDWYTDAVGETPCTLLIAFFPIMSPLASITPTVNRYDLPEAATNLQQRMSVPIQYGI